MGIYGQSTSVQYSQFVECTSVTASVETVLILYWQIIMIDQ